LKSVVNFLTTVEVFPLIFQMSKRKQIVEDAIAAYMKAERKSRPKRSSTKFVPRAPKAVVPVELKFIDVFSDTDGGIEPASGDTTSALEPLNDVKQGDDRNLRIGRKIKMTRLDLRVMPIIDGSAATSALGHHFRVIVVVDKYGDGITLPTADLIYLQDGNLGSPNILPWGGREMTQPERFKVILDYHFPDPVTSNTAGTLSTAGYVNPYYETHIPLDKKSISLVSYEGSGETANKNRMFIFFVSTLTAALNLRPAIRIHSRVWFSDV